MSEAEALSMVVTWWPWVQTGLAALGGGGTLGGVLYTGYRMVRIAERVETDIRNIDTRLQVLTRIALEHTHDRAGRVDLPDDVRRVVFGGA
jgi:hypothetical protein